MANRYDDGYSAMERAGYPRLEHLVSEGALGSRLGPRQLPAHDVRNKLDIIYLSELLEGQGTGAELSASPGHKNV